MDVKQLFFLPLVLFMIFSCNNEVTPPSAEFQQKWYAGQAEVNSYTLDQARYGEMRKGEAVLIFVTEDFSTRDLVKLDNPENTGKKIRVMKMNFTKKFITGIYPYSMMLSVFTPISKEGNEKTLKADCTSQEWCGHTFSRLKSKGGNNYNYQLHSYFEQEGEIDTKIDATVLEDEIWTRIRINPSSLPQGKVLVLPGLLWQRVSHSDLKEMNAELSLSKADTLLTNDSSAQMYSIHYPDTQRTLRIYFQQKFPHEIIGWQETYPDGFGNNKIMLTTRAVRKKTIWLNYWKHNKNADETYRDTLQLRKYE